MEYLRFSLLLVGSVAQYINSYIQLLLLLLLFYRCIKGIVQSLK